MSWIATGVSAAGAVYGASQSGKAASQAAGASKDAMIQQHLANQQMMQMLKPYRQAGNTALGGELDLLGLNGADAQAAAIQALEQSPYFTSLVQQGENAILQNASATGGLRGGNTQGALAQFRPQMLAQTIENQYGKLMGLAGRGQNAAAMTGANLQQGAQATGGYMANTGMLQAQGTAAQGQTIANLIGEIGKGYGAWQAQQGGGTPSTQSSYNQNLGTLSGSYFGNKFKM